MTGYVSALFTLLAVALGAFAASRVAATAADETAGRLTLLYSRPVGRARWAATEAAAIAGAAVVLAAAAGLAAWAGTAWVDAGLGLGQALAGALAVLPVALLCLGAALAALGWAPSAVLAIGVTAGGRRVPAAGVRRHLRLARRGPLVLPVRAPRRRPGRAVERSRRAGHARQSRHCSPWRGVCRYAHRDLSQLIPAGGVTAAFAPNAKIEWHATPCMLLDAVADRLDAARADQVLTNRLPDAPVARIGLAD